MFDSQLHADAKGPQRDKCQEPFRRNNEFTRRRRNSDPVHMSTNITNAYNELFEEYPNIAPYNTSTSYIMSTDCWPITELYSKSSRVHSVNYFPSYHPKIMLMDAVKVKNIDQRFDRIVYNVHSYMDDSSAERTKMQNIIMSMLLIQSVNGIGVIQISSSMLPIVSDILYVLSLLYRDVSVFNSQVNIDKSYIVADGLNQIVPDEFIISLTDRYHHIVDAGLSEKLCNIPIFFEERVTEVSVSVNGRIRSSSNSTPTHRVNRFTNERFEISDYLTPSTLSMIHTTIDDDSPRLPVVADSIVHTKISPDLVQNATSVIL